MPTTDDYNDVLRLVLNNMTVGVGSEAALIADWLEENGSPQDEWVFALTRYLAASPLFWHTRVYTAPPPFDVNWNGIFSHAIVREPIAGIRWAVVAFAVPIIGYRIYRAVTPAALWVRLDYGREGVMQPIGSLADTVTALTTQGVPVLPDDAVPPVPGVVAAFRAAHPLA